MVMARDELQLRALAETIGGSGARIGNLEAFQKFTRDRALESEIGEAEQRIQFLGGTPLPLPPGTSREDTVFFRQRQLDAVDPERRARGKQQFERVIFGLNPLAARIGRPLTPLVPEEAVQALPGPAQPFAEAARQLTSPAVIAGLGAGAGIAPLRAGLGTTGAIGAETAVGFGGALLGEGARAAGAPLPVQIGADVLGSLVTAGGIARGPEAIGASIRAAQRQVPEVAESAARAVDVVTGGRGPIGVVEAAGPEDIGRQIDVTGQQPPSQELVEAVRAGDPLTTELIQQQAQAAGVGRLADDAAGEIAAFRASEDGAVRVATDNAINNLAETLRQAQPLSPEAIRTIRRAELSGRVGAGAAQLEQIEGQAGFRAGRAALQGPLSDPAFAKPVIAGNDLFLMTERIRKFPFARQVAFFSKINAESGLQKILTGRVPQRNELALLERVFGRNFVEAFLARPRRSRIDQGFLVDVLGIPKTILSAFDLSFPFRQGLLLGARNPKEFAGAFKAMFRAFSSEKAFLINREIFNDPDIRLLTEGPGETKLFLGDVRGRNPLTGKVEGAAPAALSKQDEAFISRFAARLPGIEISNRTFNTFGNKLRHDVAKKTLNQWRRDGVDITDPERLSSLSRFLNIFTGRGELGPLEAIRPALNIGFWAPGLIAARLQTPFVLRDPNVRKIAAQNLASTFGLGMSVLALVKFSGHGSVELDPRSSDFGKIKIGRSRIDFWGGFQPIARYMAQIVTGQRKGIESGEIQAISRDTRSKAERERNPRSRFERAAQGAIPTGGRFIRSKLAPGPVTILANELFGRTFLGEPLTEPPVRGRSPRLQERFIQEPLGLNTAREIEAANQILPLFGRDLVDAMEEHGILGGGALSLGPLFGMGLQTFEPTQQEAAAGR